MCLFVFVLSLGSSEAVESWMCLSLESYLGGWGCGRSGFGFCGVEALLFCVCGL